MKQLKASVSKFQHVNEVCFGLYFYLIYIKILQMRWLYAFFITLVGLVVGSFLNVCIYRIPKGMSILKPPSHCPHCGRKIKFYDNIPVISYIILGGKCRYCKAKISIRYPLVELLTGLLFLVSYLRFGITWELLKVLVFVTFSECIAFIDGEHMIVPDVVSFPAIAVGLLFALFSVGITLKNAVLGAILGAGVMFIFRLTGKLIFQREALGDGDIVIMAMIGVFTGPLGVFISILFGSLLGSIIGIILLVKKKTDILPFGPFLVLGSFIYVFLIQYSNYLTIG